MGTIWPCRRVGEGKTRDVIGSSSSFGVHISNLGCVLMTLLPMLGMEGYRGWDPDRPRCGCQANDFIG